MDRYFLVYLTIAGLLLAVPGSGQAVGSQRNPANSANPETIAEQVQGFAEKQATEDKFSGVVLIAKSGKTVLERAYGLADKKTKTPNSMTTKFDLGSMPKMFTAAAVAQLVDAGKLSYNDTVGKYLPDYPNAAVRAKVTIHQLLTHTAGFGNYFHPGFRERRLKTIPEYLAFVAEDPLIGEPGQQWQYSNSGYVVLGAIIEKASGQDFYEYVREHVLKQAGMPNTGYYTTDERISNVATGYTSGGGFMMIRPGEQPSATAGPPPGKPSPGIVIQRPPDGASAPTSTAEPRRDNIDLRPYRGSPAGGAYSTVGDLLNFVDALTSGKLVSTQSLQMLQQGKVPTRPDGPKYAYGFYEWTANGHRVVGHGGGGPGVNGMLQIYPDLGYTVIVLSNYDPPAAEEIAARARDLITQ